MFIRLCSDYANVIRALRDRTDEMQISRGDLDDIAGLSDGYSAKLLSMAPSKVLGPMSMRPTLESLGLRLQLIEDTEATQRTIGRRVPVMSSHRRLGNKSNPKPSLKIENTETAEAAAPGRNDPPPETRAHLRVVQNRRGSKYG